MDNLQEDPARYRSLSEPHDNVEKANAAVRAFFDEVEKLREKYRIPDLLIVMRLNVLHEDGQEFSAWLSGRWGDNWLHESMVARELGRIQVERQREIARLMRGGALMEPQSPKRD